MTLLTLIGPFTENSIVLNGFTYTVSAVMYFVLLLNVKHYFIEWIKIILYILFMLLLLLHPFNGLFPGHPG